MRSHNQKGADVTWRLLRAGPARPLHETCAEMPVDLQTARRIAAEVVAAEHPSLRVAGATISEGSNYSEIIVTVTNCHAEPCRILIGVSRDMSEPAFRMHVGEQLRRHVGNPQSDQAVYTDLSRVPDTETQQGEGPDTPMRKVDEVANTLDGLSVTVDEIKDEDGKGIGEKRLDDLKTALESASDIVDDIEDRPTDRRH